MVKTNVAAPLDPTLDGQPAAAHAFARSSVSMHPLVDRLPPPSPDYRRFLLALRRERPPCVPLIELAVHPRIVATLLEEPEPLLPDLRIRLRAAAEQAVRLHHRLGYDVMKVSAAIPFQVTRLTAAGEEAEHGARPWTDEHHGPIASRADLEHYPWPTASDVDFGPVEAATPLLPDGLRLLGFAGGVLEFAMDLMGMTPLMVATRRDPQLVAAVIERVGRVLYGVFETYCHYESICALWLGDDLGHKHGLLVSPAFLTQHVVPWYQRFAALAHRHGRPFLLHTCGNTAGLMPALVAAGIDAKHSFEDAIQPVERFIDEWGARVAVLGGVDVHRLATGTPDSIRQRTLEILAYAAPRGGYAAGSGNSIPDYIPPENYLAMIAAVADFNGR